MSALPYYESLFAAAFPDSVTNYYTPANIGTALAAFCSSINSSNTKFDQSNFQPGILSSIEPEGKNLFFTKYNCSSCHLSVTVPNPYGFDTTQAFLNIGLDVVYADKGLGARTGKSSDDGKFKVPSLRNIALTAPYMHDGRFATLNDVLEHYSHGITDNANLDSRLRDSSNQPRRMNISDHEKEALIAFLNTLTDYSAVLDKKFSSPFVVVQ